MLERAVVRRAEVRPLLADAWTRRSNLTVADALYVVLAEHVGATLVTADERLARSPDSRYQRSFRSVSKHRHHERAHRHGRATYVPLAADNRGQQGTVRIGGISAKHQVSSRMPSVTDLSTTPRSKSRTN